jgi:glutamate---cysteine ligase / carboxylate-amine ligase
MRSVGVEEELLLVDGRTGEPRAVAGAVLRRAAAAPEVGSDLPGGGDRPADGPGGTLEGELHQQQVETDTPPQTDLSQLADQLRTWRRRADRAAAGEGARVAALATSPLPVTPVTTPTERYLRMAQHFGLTQAEQLTCGCHVHVSVKSPEEGVAVLDRIRVWLPVLTALSANSPYWQGEDSGYASFRSQAWGRWPTAGPIEVQGSVERYRALVRDLVATGVALDEGMVYFDARLSARYPTLEVRVADVCLRVDDAVLIAALARGLVDTAAREWGERVPAPPVPSTLVRLAGWRAARGGLDDVLLHPADLRPRPAEEVVSALVRHVRRALERSGDAALVHTLLADLLGRGTGARRQREILGRSGRLADVVHDAVEVTAS